MKIIVTGATGAFGAAIIRYLHKAGHEIIATGRSKNPPEELLALAIYIQADITKPFELPQADVCIHAGALSDDKANMKQLYAPNIEGTRNVMNAAKDCEKFIFVSSSSVYLPNETPITEDMAGKQNNKLLSAYGLSKLQSEDVLHNKFKGKACFILRPRAFYGPGDTQIMPRMMKLEKKGVFNRPGKLEIDLSMTHYHNMGAAIECCMKSELEGIRTYNVADDEVYVMISTLRNLFKTIYRKDLPEKEVKIGLLKFLAFFRIMGFTPLLVRALTQNMVLDISKIKAELGYDSVITLADSLKDIDAWVQRIGGAEVLKNADNSLAWKYDY